MNSLVKSHLQLAHAQSQEEATTVAIPFGAGHSRLLRPIRVRHIQRHLLLANKNQEKFIGHQSLDSNDPCGSILRRLRNQQGLEAFVVASKACITVWQLYELETGKDSLFYTPGLRLKAAQRVAAILGSNWDDVVAGRAVTKAASGPAAQLHLLKPPASPALLKTAPLVPVSETPRVSVQRQSFDTAPLSLALLLRTSKAQN